MKARHRSTLIALFADPVRASIPWRDVEGLFRALGAEVSEGRGSRVRVELAEAEAVFHRPHPRKETNKGAVKAVRRFLLATGVEPP
ncbi:MAG: type II toxin-antitoxin system HicA family toxin [bacterium]|nr:type II toxin-antitoxin system HicA family toxin [bacterium]